MEKYSREFEKTKNRNYFKCLPQVAICSFRVRPRFVPIKLFGLPAKGFATKKPANLLRLRAIFGCGGRIPTIPYTCNGISDFLNSAASVAGFLTYLKITGPTYVGCAVSIRCDAPSDLLRCLPVSICGQ